MGEGSTLWVIFKKIIGFAIFLALLWVASYLRVFITNSFYQSVVQFLLDNLNLSILIFFFSIFSTAFWNLGFPVNLPAPIFSAFSSFYVVKYLYNLWLFANIYSQMAMDFPIRTLEFLVFGIVLVVGYIVIVSRSGRVVREKGPAEEKEESEDEPVEEEKRKVEWHQIGEEFKSAIYGIGRSLNDLFTSKKTEKPLEDKVEVIHVKKAKRKKKR